MISKIVLKCSNADINRTTMKFVVVSLLFLFTRPLPFPSATARSRSCHFRRSHSEPGKKSASSLSWFLLQDCGWSLAKAARISFKITGGQPFLAGIGFKSAFWVESSSESRNRHWHHRRNRSRCYRFLLPPPFFRPRLLFSPRTRTYSFTQFLSGILTSSKLNFFRWPVFSNRT